MNAFLDMCNIILDEHDIPALAERLADYMGNPILIEDQSFKLIATSELNKAVHPEHIELFSVRRSEPMLTELRLKLMEEPGNLLRHTLTVKGKKVEQEIMPIMVGSNIISYVSVLGADQPVSEEKRDLFIICASAIARDMHQKLYIRSAVFNERNRFLKDMLDSKVDDTVCSNLAGIIGFDDRIGKIPLALGISRKDDNLSYSFFNYYAALIEQQVSDFFSSRGIPSFICEQSGCLVMFINAEKGEDGRVLTDEAVLNLVTRLQEHLEAALPGTTKISVGIGRRATDIRSSRIGCTEAIEALQFVQNFKPGFSIAEYKKNSHHILITSILKEPEAAKAFCTNLLGKLIERDQQEDSELLKTLETYLECNSSFAETGKAMFLHPKTIKYRIEQILKLLPLDLSDMNDRSVVWIALKLLPQRGHQARHQVG